MKKIFDMVSDMIVPGIIFTALVASITAGALLTKTGQRMEAPKQSFSGSADTAATEESCAREAPVIACTGKTNWKTGETIHVDSIFSATDAEGNTLAVKVRDITDAEGNSAMDSYEKTGNTASFSRSGIYTFRLKAIDSERKTAEAAFPVAIDSR